MASNGAIEEAGKVAGGAIDAMRSAPLAIALLLVNLGFLAFSGYIAHEATRNTRAREAAHNDLVLSILKQCEPHSLESKPN